MENILVLCTGNSCRSIMAESLINHLVAHRYTAKSAGSRPVGYVHPKSIKTLEHHGIAVKQPRSQSWDEFSNQSFDLIITVCDSAAAESCPVYLREVKQLHWSTPDPAKVEGSEEDINAAFDQAFELLRKRIEKELL